MEDLYKPGDLITTIVNKAVAKQDSGLKIEAIDGKCFVRKVTGLMKDRNIPVQMGDQIVELNDRPPEDYVTIERMKKELRDCKRIKVVLVRSKPGAYRSVHASREHVGGGEASDSEGHDDAFMIRENGEDGEEVPDFPRLTNENDHPRGKPPSRRSRGNKVVPYDDDNRPLVRAGSVMELHSLTSRAELNGSLVDVIEEDIKPGRWLVELHGFDESKLSVSENNLKPPSDEAGVDVQHGAGVFSNEEGYNGRTSARGHSEDDALRMGQPGSMRGNMAGARTASKGKSTSSVSTTTPSVIPYGKAQTLENESVIVLGTAQSPIKAGDMMKLRRLKAKAKWNGKLVKVEGKDMDSMDEDEERWLVEIMESGEIVSIATKNLVAV